MRNKTTNERQMINSKISQRRMTIVSGIILMLFIVNTPAMAQPQQQKFAIEPEDTQVVIGQTIVLPCRVVGKQGILQWTKDDFGLGSHRNLTAFERYYMIGHDDDGDYSLRIESVTLDDDARFQCQVSPGPNGQPGIRSRFATLTVLVPPQPPVITQGDFLLVTEGQETHIECVSKSGKPSAELTWIDGSGNVIDKNVEYSEEVLSDGKRSTVRSILKLSPKRHHHNVTLTCQSQNMADRNFKSAEIKIEVKYAPKINLFLETNDSDGTILENSEAKFHCIADGNPSEITYKWFVNNEFIVGDYTTEMVMHNVSRSHHKAIIKCEATNDIGTKEDSIPLNIKYPPIFKQSPVSIDADDREDVILTCEADGNPVEIVWVHDPIDRLNFHPRVVGTTNVLDITVSNETAGRYFCKAIVSGFPEIKSEAIVYMKQAPIIESPRIQYGSKGDTLRLECSAFSVPKARHISWSFNGHEINPVTDRDYSILDDPSPRRIKSTLIIQDSQDWHFGKYNCTVVNDYGVDVLQIELMQQNNFQFLMIIVGATSGVVILVIIVVLFLCIKLKGKTDNRSSKEKSYSADVIPNKTIINDQCCREGDESSHSSEYKPDIKAGSSESDYSIASTNFVESTIDAQEVRGSSVPLAGPVDFPVHYRHSADYADPNRYYPPPKYGYGNYGYETHTDYARYSMAPSQKYANQQQRLTVANAENYPPHYGGGRNEIGVAIDHEPRHIGTGTGRSGGSGGGGGGANGASADSIVAIRQENGLPAGTRSSLIV